MNNKTIVWVVVAAVVVVGLGWWFLGRGPSGSAPGNTVAGTATQTPAATPTSLAALLALGTSQKCTFNDTNSSAGTTTNGTVYVASGHMRGDFISQNSDGTTVTSHMISDGTNSWMWSSAMPQGMEMSFASMAMSSTPSAPGQPAAPSAGINPDNTENYSCSGWTEDSSEFTLPAGVTFENMTQMMQNMEGAAAGANAGAAAGVGAGAGAGAGNSAECSACNSITNANSKAACMAALGCK